MPASLPYLERERFAGPAVSAGCCSLCRSARQGQRGPGNGRLRRGEYTEKFRRHSFPIAEQLPGHAGAGATGQLSFIVGAWSARPASPPRSTDDSTSPAIAITGARSCRGSSRPLIRCITPGPAVPQTATVCPVRPAPATAAKAPYSSCRTCTESTEPLRRSASITGSARRLRCRKHRRTPTAVSISRNLSATLLANVVPPGDRPVRALACGELRGPQACDQSCPFIDGIAQ